MNNNEENGENGGKWGQPELGDLFSDEKELRGTMLVSGTCEFEK